MKANTFVAIAGMIGVCLFVTPVVFAHILVTPDTVGIGSSQTFDLVAHNDTNSPLIGARILIPSGVTDVVPDAVPGWTISTKTSGTGDSAAVTEIDWSGGFVPPGQRDHLTFGATVPVSETHLLWKSYTMYGDGTTMSWDQPPNPTMSDADREAMEKKMIGPASQTDVINDLKPATGTSSSTSETPIIMSGVAIFLSLAALGLAMKRRPS